jgi:hypothetical protein
VIVQIIVQIVVGVLATAACALACALVCRRYVRRCALSADYCAEVGERADRLVVEIEAERRDRTATFYTVPEVRTSSPLSTRAQRLRAEGKHAWPR